MKTKKLIRSYGIKTSPIKKVLKWKLNSLLHPNKIKPEEKNFSLDIKPIGKKDLQTKEDFIIWLGHATFYIQLGGVKILTDPVFGDVPLTPRLAPMPLSPSDLKPDIILISHGHYDHLDLNSLNILDIYTKKTKLILPLRLSDYLEKNANTLELDWFESAQMQDVKITVLPASHWHRRGLFDFNRALWCSFLIQSKNKTVYFAGDSAFDTHFQKIKEHITNIDVALLPIGAYMPTEVMKDNHMNPQEAVDAAKILDAGLMIPYHYGTFKLSDEPISEPYIWITELAQTSGINIKIAKIGEIIKDI